MAVIFNFELSAGDNALLEITVYNADGTLMDLTNVTLKWSSQYQADGTTRVDRTIGTGITLTDATNGRANIAIAKGSITKTGQHAHELEAISGSNSQTVLEGIINVVPTLNPST